MLILKEVKKAKQDHQRRKAKKTAFKYSKKLIEDGWYQIPVEGALFSKNGLAIYYHLRDPYRGQMKRCKFSENKEEDKLLEQQYQQFIQKYMDDFVIISEDLEQLKRWEKQIEIFLADVLKLQLNPKTTIVYAKNGVDFVGYRHWNSTKKIRKDAMRRLKRLMKNFKDGTITEEFFDKSFTSRIGSIKHADTYNLVQKITCEAKELKESHA